MVAQYIYSFNYPCCGSHAVCPVSIFGPGFQLAAALGTIRATKP